MEDKLLYQQKSALVFTEVSIAVDIKVLEDVTTATFCGSWFSVSSASQGKKTQIKNPYSSSKYERTEIGDTQMEF